MTSIRALRHVALIGALAILATSAAAAPVPGENPLAEVPAGAGIVVHVHGFERTKGRLVTMIKNAIPDLGMAAQGAIEQGIAGALQERKIQGVPADGAILAVWGDLPKGPEDAEKFFFVIRVTKYSDFRDGILTGDEKKDLKADPAGFEEAEIDGQKAYFIDRKTYALVTPDKDVAVKLTKKEVGLDDKLDRTIAKRLIDADLAVYVNTEMVNKAFGDPIKDMQKQAENALDQAAGQFGGANKHNLAVAKAMVGPAFQAFADSKAMLATVEFRPEGFALHLEALVSADSKTGRFFRGSKPVPFAQIGRLPSGGLLYDGLQMGPDVMKAMAPFLLGAISEGNDKQAKAVTDAVEQIAGSKPAAKIDTVNLPAQSFSVWSFEDPVKAATAQLKLFQSLQSGESFGGGMLKDKPEVKVDDQKYRGFELHHVHMQWDLDAMVRGADAGGLLGDEQKKQMKAAMAKALGEGRNLWFGTDGKQVVQVAGKEWGAAKEMLDAYLEGKSPVGQVAAYKEARKQLPAEASFLMLMDVPQYAVMMTEFMEPFMGMLPLPPGIFKPAVKGETCYLGTAVALQPDRAGFDLWIPGQAANQIYKMFIERALKGAPQ